MRREWRERFPRHHHGLAIPTCMPTCMPGSLTSGFFLSLWRGNRSWHSRRMHNPQFYVSGKRPMSQMRQKNPTYFLIWQNHLMLQYREFDWINACNVSQSWYYQWFMPVAKCHSLDSINRMMTSCHEYTAPSLAFCTGIQRLWVIKHFDGSFVATPNKLLNK